MSISFAYMHCKPNGIPFYVGKGALRRAKNLSERNPYHQSVVSKYGKENILIGKMECSSEKIAFELEKGLIKCLKSSGVKLTNFTDGGEGTSNPTKETRQKLSDSAKKRGVSIECQEAKVKALKGKQLSEEHKEKLRQSLNGKMFTEEHRKNISISAKKRGMEAAHKALAMKRLQDKLEKSL